MPAPDALALRRGLLAVSVLHDLDVVPDDEGAGLPGTRPGAPDLHLPATELRRALAGADPEGELGRLRLLVWLRARRGAADLPAEALRAALVPAGLPVGHALHPGFDWVCRRLLGGALDLGIGAVGLDPDDPDAVLLLPPPALCAAGLVSDDVWPALDARLEQLGEGAAERLQADAKGLLRPFGPADVVTLLGARSLRAALARSQGGMGTVVVPMRRRGWTRLALIDPAFGPAAAAATGPAERGFDRPLLVTVDEIVLAAEGGRPAAALQDPAADAPWLRDVLYR